MLMTLQTLQMRRRALLRAAIVHVRLFSEKNSKLVQQISSVHAQVDGCTFAASSTTFFQPEDAQCAAEKAFHAVHANFTAHPPTLMLCFTSANRTTTASILSHLQNAITQAFPPSSTPSIAEAPAASEPSHTHNSPQHGDPAHNPTSPQLPFPIIGCSSSLWIPQESLLSGAGGKPVPQHVTVAAAYLPHITAHGFYSATDSLPYIPHLREALTSRPPQFLLMSCTGPDTQLKHRLENLFPGSILATMVASQRKSVASAGVPVGIASETMDMDSESSDDESNGNTTSTTKPTPTTTHTTPRRHRRSRAPTPAAVKLALEQLHKQQSMQHDDREVEVEGAVQGGSAEVVGKEMSWEDDVSPRVMLDSEMFGHGSAGVLLLPESPSHRLPPTSVMLMLRTLCGMEKLPLFDMAPHIDALLRPSLLPASKMLHPSLQSARQFVARSFEGDATESLPPVLKEVMQAFQIAVHETIHGSIRPSVTETPALQPSPSIQETLSSPSIQDSWTSPPIQEAQPPPSIQDTRSSTSIQESSVLAPSLQDASPPTPTMLPDVAVSMLTDVLSGKDHDTDRTSDANITSEVNEGVQAVDLLLPDITVKFPVPESADVVPQADVPLPVFPLGADFILFPGETKQLRIFENRYQLLVRAAVEQGGVFGLPYKGSGILAQVVSHLTVGEDLVITIRATGRFTYPAYSLTALPATFGLACAPTFFPFHDAPMTPHEHSHSLSLLSSIRTSLLEGMEDNLMRRYSARVFESAMHLEAEKSEVSKPEIQKLDEAGKLEGHVRALAPTQVSELSFLLASHTPSPDTATRREWMMSSSTLWRLEQIMGCLDTRDIRMVVSEALFQLSDSDPLRVMLGLPKLAK